MSIHIQHWMAMCIYISYIEICTKHEIVVWKLGYLHRDISACNTIQ